MEFKFRSVDDRPPPSPSSAVSYFSSEQTAFRGQTAALITSSLAASSTQPNFAPPRTPPPSIFRNPDMRLNLDPAQNPKFVRDDMIERQLEKEMIREEIIAAKIKRRRALEAEVRRELMLEREIAMRRPAGEGLGGAMLFDHRVHHPFDDDRFGFFASRAPAAFDRFTWRQQLEPLTNGFKSHPAPPPTLDLNNKDKLILLAKPDPNLSGVKWKTPPTVSASELPPFGLKKIPKEEWSCDLCHISATSEKDFIHHINGKKHQAKEATLRAQKPSSSNAQSSKKAANFSEPNKINGIRSTELRAKQVDVSNEKMQEQGTSKKEKEELPMLKDQCGEVLKNKDEVKMVEAVERKEDVQKQKKFEFWCESCKIGACNPKVWSSHISGKKHIARSQELTQNNVPIASFMASSEASKDAEGADAAKEAQEKIPTATAMASSEASIEAEDSDAAKEAHQIATPTAIPSADASNDAEDADAAKEADENFAPPRPPAPSIFRNPDMRLNLDPAQNPRSVHDEMIEHQLEKEMIREEIIVAEIARRRALEVEVRRELMLEREIAMRRPTGEGLGFDQDQFGAMRFDHSVPHPFDDDRFGFFASHAPASFDSFTWRRQLEPLTNGFKSHPAPPPTLDLNNKDKLILLAKPDPNLSEVKWKTPPTVSASELPPFGLKKIPKEEWSCDLCHVSATSEKDFIHHINGKKHQAKEATLRAQKPSSSNAQSSKKAANFSEPEKINSIRSTELRAKQVRKSLGHNETSDVSNEKMQEQGTSKKEKEELPMLKDQCGEVLKNKDEVKMVEGVERKEDVQKQKKFEFWCESCKIGACNPKVWSSHISGKKHIARSQAHTQNNVPIASFMASAEASKDAEGADAAKEAQEKIPTATAMASSEASIEAEDSDAAKEAHQIATPSAIPSAEASKDAEDAGVAKEAHENFVPPRLPAPSIFRNPDIRLNLDPAQNPRSVHDKMIEHQLEKEMIREEIITAEIARRRALEAEVRRELMLEREIAMRRPTGEGLGFDQDRFGAMRFDHSVPHPFDDDRFGFFASRATATFDSFAWRRQLEPLTNGFKSHPAPTPTLDLNNKDKLILLAKPDPNLSGVKWKTPPTVSASELPPFGLKKIPKEEWSCALCHVSATSEKDFIHHINGKKHQAKEATLRAQKPSSSNAQSSKKAANFSEPEKINGIRSTELRAKQVRKSLGHNATSDVSNQKMQEQGTSKKERGEPPMLKDQCGEVLKNKDEVKMVEAVERKDVKKQKKFEFWCECCKIGACNPKVWSSHISGKKHIARSQELTQNNVPIASFMASSEVSKDTEGADAAKEAQEKIPTATVMALSEASIEAEDSDAAKEAHQIPTPTAIPSAEASKDAEDADAAKEAHKNFAPPRPPAPSIFRNPDMRLNLDPAQNPRSIHDEMIERQLEKEIIREEIVAAEIARRQALEAEVRRELMLEREEAPSQGSKTESSETRLQQCTIV